MVTPLHRLHPLTPFLRSWRPIGVAIAAGLGIFRDDLSRLRWIWDALHGDVETSVLLEVLGAVFLLALVSIAVGWLSWRVTGFRVVTDNAGAETLLLHDGLLVRRRRQVRLNRIQSVDLNQPVIPRVLGLATVRLEMAAGEEASVNLSYLPLEEAGRLRSELLRLAGGQPIPTAESTDAVGSQSAVVAMVPVSRVIVASVLEGLGQWLTAVGYLLVMIVLSAVYGGSVLLAGAASLLPLTLGALAYLRKRALEVLRDANFTLSRTATGVRVEAGLTSTVSRSISLDRIQALRLQEPYLWRRLGWARVTVDVAGDAEDKHDDKLIRNSLLPVADRAEALRLIETVSGADLSRLPIRSAGPGGRLLDPWGFDYLGVALLPTGAVTRKGRLRRTHFYVPYARIQSVAVHQGPLQRQRDVATVRLDLAKGAGRWEGPHREVTEAAALVGALIDCAHRHRQAAASPAHSRP